jgi:hypothetical protein
MIGFLVIAFLVIDVLVSYLLARSIGRKLFAKGNRYAAAISVFLGILFFLVILVAVVVIVALNVPFER